MGSLALEHIQAEGRAFLGVGKSPDLRLGGLCLCPCPATNWLCNPGQGLPSSGPLYNRSECNILQGLLTML